MPYLQTMLFNASNINLQTVLFNANGGMTTYLFHPPVEISRRNTDVKNVEIFPIAKHCANKTKININICYHTAELIWSLIKICFYTIDWNLNYALCY